MRYFYIMAIIISMASTSLIAQDNVNNTQHATITEFNIFLSGLKQQALNEHISPHLVDSIFATIKAPLKEAIKQDRKQPEFILDFWQYYKRGISNLRIKRGSKEYAAQHKALQPITMSYHVPAHILIALWGLETNFGDYMGNFPIVQSLATLAFDKRRRSFFSKQFLAFLHIIQDEQLNHETLHGSWAGAFGQNQFMPTTFLQYAVDGDGDGKRDTWNNITDIMASSAHYLYKIGWRNNERWGRQVLLPDNFLYFKHATMQAWQPLNFWRDAGLKTIYAQPLPNADIQAKLLLPMGSEGPAFLVYHNFYVIKKWNNSDLYALNVGLLSDKIQGHASHKLLIPPHHKPIAIAVVKKVQTILKAQHYYDSAIDGKIGKGTKKGLIQWQNDNNMTIIDGWPNRETLQKMGLL